MKKRNEIDNIESCLNKADEDEPLFVLRANDELAPDIVREWARMYDRQKRDEGMSPTQHRKHEEALQIADAMEDWKRDQRLRDCREAGDEAAAEAMYPTGEQR